MNQEQIHATNKIKEQITLISKHSAAVKRKIKLISNKLNSYQDDGNLTPTLYNNFKMEVETSLTKVQPLEFEIYNLMINNDFLKIYFIF